MDITNAKTLTGLTVAEAAIKLDEQLPPDAYTAVPGGADLTDIDPNYMRKTIERGLRTVWFRLGLRVRSRRHGNPQRDPQDPERQPRGRGRCLEALALLVQGHRRPGDIRLHGGCIRRQRITPAPPMP